LLEARRSHLDANVEELLHLTFGRRTRQREQQRTQNSDESEHER
jgi:hypothetical protein